VTGFRVCFPFAGDTVGGSHISALELIGALPREGMEPLVAVHREGPLTQMLVERNVRYEIAPDVTLAGPGTIARQLVDMASAAASLARFLRGRKIDIVHTNDARMHLTWGPAARLAGAGFVWHQRSADPSRRLSFYSRLANEVLTISHFCKAELGGAMRQRAKIVINPFDTGLAPPDRARARQALLDELNLPRETRAVGYFSNFMPRKRPDMFVKVVERVRERVGALVCPMFGDPRERAEVDRLVAEKKLERNCPIMGFRTPVATWMAACDVVVAPAVREPYGRTLIESMLAGTPVVAAAEGGHIEIVDHERTGLLVEPDNVEAFAAAVLRLLRDEKAAREMAGRAREAALARYSVRNHANAIANIYRHIRSGSGPKSN
jgi:glycosyltransferase involved in cell wall biosynthesis